MFAPRSDNRGPVVAPIGTAVTPFPAEHLQKIIAAYESGATLYTIAREWKLGKQTVRICSLKLVSEFDAKDWMITR